jgi:hypothetical protein
MKDKFFSKNKDSKLKTLNTLLPLPDTASFYALNARFPLQPFPWFLNPLLPMPDPKRQTIIV